MGILIYSEHSEILQPSREKTVDTADRRVTIRKMVKNSIRYTIINEESHTS
jgi:hypothetical protein